MKRTNTSKLSINVSKSIELNQWVGDDKVWIMDIQGVELIIKEKDRDKFIKFLQSIGLHYESSETYETH